MRGGPSRDDLKGQNARIDTEVRLQISAEMGHGRLNITRLPRQVIAERTR